jgi:hypothetical protein
MLSLVQEIMDPGIPQELLTTMRSSTLEGSPRDLLVPMMELVEEPAIGVLPVLVGIWSQRSQGDQIRRFFYHLFLPREAMESVYGVRAKSPRIWLMYLWRPIDLLARYGRSLVAVIRRDPKVARTLVQQARLEEWLRHDEMDGRPR